jgi:polar amino acid transport system substrate-binding protein
MELNPSVPSPSSEAVAAIAPTGVLRAGINLANTLLVTGRDDAGRPTGVSPSLASAVSEALGVPLELVSFPGPGELVDALSADRLDIGNIGADPDRATEIDFTNPYCTIDATYLVRTGSGFASVDDVDRPGVRIVSRSRAAYTLWLERNIRNASLLQTETLDEAVDKFVADGLDALAGLRPGLLSDLTRVEGGRVLEDGFTSVLQAVGIHHSRDGSGLAYLDSFVVAAVGSGMVAQMIESFDVRGLTVAHLQ